MIDIKEILLQWFINFFDKKSASGAATLAWSETLATQNKSAIKNEIMSNKKLSKELHKPIIRKSEKGMIMFCG